MKSYVTMLMVAAAVAGMSGSVHAEDKKKDAVGQVCDQVVEQMKRLHDVPYVAPVRPQLKRVIKETQDACDKYGTSGAEAAR